MINKSYLTNCLFHQIAVVVRKGRNEFGQESVCEQWLHYHIAEEVLDRAANDVSVVNGLEMMRRDSASQEAFL